jgi:hypothetical protein
MPILLRVTTSSIKGFYFQVLEEPVVQAQLRLGPLPIVNRQLLLGAD